MAGIGHADGGIARPTFGDRKGDGTAAAEVECEELRCFRWKAVQAGTEAFDEINHLDGVKYAVAIGSGSVVAEHLELRSAVDGHLSYEGEEVVCNAQRVFANADGRMGAPG